MSWYIPFKTVIKATIFFKVSLISIILFETFVKKQNKKNLGKQYCIFCTGLKKNPQDTKRAQIFAERNAWYSIKWQLSPRWAYIYLTPRVYICNKAGSWSCMGPVLGMGGGVGLSCVQWLIHRVHLCVCMCMLHVVLTRWGVRWTVSIFPFF